MRTTAAHLRFAALLCCAPLAAAAHDSPEHVIEELTKQMAKDGESAELLTERAVEYRVLGKLAEATKDLERAARLEPNSTAIQRELGRVLFLGGKPVDAIAVVTRGLTFKTDDPIEVASLRILRAEIFRSQNDNQKALEDCEAALRLHKLNPEWYLLRSDIQKRLHANKERLAGINEGIKETGAGVLEIERVEALIDTGQFDASLKIIDTELADSRIKSSWLIRRGRALLGLGKKAEGERDLNAALQEIGTRLNPKTPDVGLLIDKARACELLGENREALRAYEEARDQGATEYVSEKIKSIQEVIARQPATAPAGKP